MTMPERNTSKTADKRKPATLSNALDDIKPRKPQKPGRVSKDEKDLKAAESELNELLKSLQDCRRDIEITGSCVKKSRAGNYFLVIFARNEKVKSEIKKILNKRKRVDNENGKASKKRQSLRVYVIVRRFKLIPLGKITRQIKNEARSGILGGMKCKSEKSDGYGTLGAVITCEVDSQKIHYAITCMHVVEKNAKKLKDTSNSDLGDIRNSISTDNSSPSNQTTPDVDFSIALLTTSNVPDAVGIHIQGGNQVKHIAKSMLEDISSGTQFQKYGGTTRITYAESFERLSVKTDEGLIFQNVFSVKALGKGGEFVQPGDSGSVLLINRGKKFYACGILFAMADDGRIGIAFDLRTAINKIDTAIRNHLNTHLKELPNG